MVFSISFAKDILFREYASMLDIEGPLYMLDSRQRTVATSAELTNGNNPARWRVDRRKEKEF
jgi:hypothetical protein